MQSLPRDREYRTYSDECINRNAGYKSTWSIPETSHVVTPDLTMVNRAYTVKAMHATYCDVEGTALRQSDGTVWFRSNITLSWTQLFDIDMAELMLFGDVALVGELVNRTA